MLSLFLLALSLRLYAAEPMLTFRDRDPVTGTVLTCDRCPPGTFLLSRCSSTQRSECAPCPEGTFTELWNHIRNCFRCRACESQQVVKSACTATSDSRCECKTGFHFKPEYGACVRHRACPPGQGALTAGTPLQDTTCQTCSNRTFSDVSSAQLGCTPQQNCSAGGLLTLVSGSTWHDSVCVDSQQLQDGAIYLKAILPPFFLRCQMNVKRLRRVLLKLPTDDGRNPPSASGLDVTELHRRINMWVESASASRLRRLPDALMAAGADVAAESLRRKLQSIEEGLEELRGLDLQNIQTGGQTF